MFRRSLIVLAVALPLLSVAVLPVHATMPTTLSVQGRLIDSSGVPFPAGEKKFQFKIFGSETGVDELWPRVVSEERQPVTTDEDGLWTAKVGAVYPLNADVFNSIEAWLQIGIGDSPREILPRVQLVSNGYSFRSNVSELAGPNSVTSGAIVSGSVRNSDLGANAVTSNKILDGEVGEQDLADWAVTAVKIANNAVTGSKIADGTVNTLDIATGGVSNSDLASNAVTSDKIADGVILSQDIGAGQIGNTKLADNAVTSAKIANSGVGNADLANNSVTSVKIATGTILNSDISASAAISPSKVSGTAATLTTSQTFTAAKNFTYNTGMGTTSPGTHKLMVESGLGGVSGATVFIRNTHAAGLGMIVEATSSDLPLLISQKGSGDIFRCDSYTGGWRPVFRVKNNGHTVASVLELTGGADLAEPFEVNGDGVIEPGMIVSIDPANPGQLRIATHAYDRTVAGIISGANGLNPGLTLKQIGSAADGGYPVALSGRVYCWTDAGYGAVNPGDFLTTSATPGHAMKVTDHESGSGAVIGKAMTVLEGGRGLVLVLVNLQ